MDELGRTHPGVLLITRNLPPLRGGMERLVQHVAQSLADGYDLSVIGPDGCTRPGGDRPTPPPVGHG